MATDNHTLPIAASMAEREVLTHIDAVLERMPSSRLDVGEEGLVELPPSVLSLLHEVVHQLSKGNAVTVVATASELTTQEAAGVLGISRTYLIRLLDVHELPYTWVGTHRRLQLTDVLEYRQRSRERQRNKIAEMVQISEEMGLYDE